MTLVDSNVIIDVLKRDLVWFGWSSAALADAGSDGAQVNPIVVAELSRDYGSYTELWGDLQALGVGSVALDEESAFTGGKRYQMHRQSREPGDKPRILPDFLIGAHALTLGVPLLTRDPRLYRRYFPELSLIAPETHHG